MNERLRIRLGCEALELRALPAVWSVAPTGSDTAAGTPAAPFATLQRAADVVQPGDTVLVQAGTYRGLNLTRSGTPTARITFRADTVAPGLVRINLPNAWNNRDGINLEGASFVTIEGFTVTDVPRAGIRSVTNQGVVIARNTTTDNGVWGIFTGFSENVRIENNAAARSKQEHGIYVSNSADNPIVRGNIVTENRASGIQLNADVSAGGDGLISGALIENNLLRANGTGGGASINLDGVINSVVRNNRIEAARATGIALFKDGGATGSRNNLVVNNTVIVDNTVTPNNGRWAVTITGGSTGNTLVNNILFSTHFYRGALNVDAGSLTGLVSNFNVVEDRFSTTNGDSVLTLSGWRTATGLDANSLALSNGAALDAVFTDRAGGNVRLRAGSVAVDRGTLTHAPATDFEGTPRPTGAAVDIGAHEYSGANTAPTITPVANVAMTLGQKVVVPFTISDAETNANNLVVTVTSTNQEMLPAQRLTVSGTGESRALTVFPGNYGGVAVVTITVTDADGLSASVTFTVTVQDDPAVRGARRKQ